MIGSKLAVAVGAVVLSGLFNLGGVKGNGNVKEETRQVGDFSGVSVGHGIEATVTIGPKTSVKLQGDENLLPLIKTELKDGKLTTSVDANGINPSRPIKLTVVTPKLTSVSAHGAAKLSAEGTTAGGKFDADASGASAVTVKGVSADKVEVEASGASVINLSGTAKQVNAEASGASVLKLRELSAESLMVGASGAASVQARASAAVEGHASGGSHIEVKGNPQQRDVSHSGGSSISFEP